MRALVLLVVLALSCFLGLSTKADSKRAYMRSFERLMDAVAVANLEASLTSVTASAPKSVSDALGNSDIAKVIADKVTAKKTAAASRLAQASKGEPIAEAARENVKELAEQEHKRLDDGQKTIEAKEVPPGPNALRKQLMKNSMLENIKNERKKLPPKPKPKEKEPLAAQATPKNPKDGKGPKDDHNDDVITI